MSVQGVSQSQRLGAGVAIASAAIMGASVIGLVVNTVIMNVVHATNLIHNAAYANMIIFHIGVLSGSLAIMVGSVAMRSIMNKKIEKNEQERMADLITAISVIVGAAMLVAGVTSAIGTFGHNIKLTHICNQISSYAALSAFGLEGISLFGLSLYALYRVCMWNPDKKNEEQVQENNRDGNTEVEDATLV